MSAALPQRRDYIEVVEDCAAKLDAAQERKDWDTVSGIALALRILADMERRGL